MLANPFNVLQLTNPLEEPNGTKTGTQEMAPNGAQTGTQEMAPASEMAPTSTTFTNKVGGQ